jgi:BioD-like phosphotransacetylase family protein
MVIDMSVKDIENAITQLSPEELVELSAWLADYQAKVWDKQIERDLDAGRLDALLEEVDEEYEAGEAESL